MIDFIFFFIDWFNIFYWLFDYKWKVYPWPKDNFELIFFKWMNSLEIVFENLIKKSQNFEIVSNNKYGQVALIHWAQQRQNINNIEIPWISNINDLMPHLTTFGLFIKFWTMHLKISRCLYGSPNVCINFPMFWMLPLLILDFQKSKSS